MATTTWTQTAGMTSDEDVDNVDSFAEQAEASKDAAAASATAAAASESAASASASSASASATTATTKASEASTSATNAATSASSASSSATSATASETAAATSKNAAAASATAAAASETAAAASETAAASSETNAATSETNAATSATSASTSATTASTAATTASTAATNAATSETNAATSASTASTAATNAATSETNAATSETNAATSATNAATSETNAATSATSASTSASAASTSATAAAASQSAAAASAASAASAYDTFDDRYLGSKTTDPTVDNDGNTLVSGALYFNSTANEMRVYDGANWIAATSAGNVSLLEYKYTATSGQTTFSGVDDSANTLSYTQDNLIVTLNGVVLENGTDYTATTGTSVVLASGAATSDELNVIAFKSFTTADMVSATNGGTFYNNIDVQGTVTADGLTVDGDATVSNAEAKLYLMDNNNIDGNALLRVNGDNFGIRRVTDDKATETNRFNLDVSTGDISFYEDTGTTAKFFWDASAESLGIGTSSPTAVLDVRRGDADGKIAEFHQSGGYGFELSSSQSVATITAGYNQAFTFETGTTATERMRIDSSGNLLVGSTDTTPYDNTSGNAIRLGDGLITSAQEGGNAAIFNRMLSDGSIVQFRKDGTTVGSIGSYSGVGMYAMAPNNGGSGLLFYDNAAPIYPIKNVSGSATIGDAYTDLGAAVHRFKDLYLSGGVYLGGTGAANKLDDYEEGTFSPTVGLDVGSGTFSTWGSYVKIGKQVTVTIRINIDTASSALMNVIGNMPFTPENLNQQAVGSVRENASTGRQWHLRATGNNTSFLLRRYDNDQAISAGYQFIGSVTYFTA